MRAIVCAVVIGGAVAYAQKPVEIDRTLQRVHGTAIMSSDIRQARLLRLVSAQSDDAIQTTLENRLLMLSEAARAAVEEPAAAQIAARRQAWTASWPAGTDVAAQLHRAGMSDRGLDGWFRDELRIEAYLTQRFPPQDPKRDERIAVWIKDLRQRANLKI